MSTQPTDVVTDEMLTAGGEAMRRFGLSFNTYGQLEDIYLAMQSARTPSSKTMEASKLPTSGEPALPEAFHGEAGVHSAGGSEARNPPPFRTPPPCAGDDVERREAIRNILYRHLPTEIDADVCRAIADEFLALDAAIAALGTTPSIVEVPGDKVTIGDEIDQ